ncbi:potassium-transporting ATPase subunit KdpC [Arthrobacter echini]|uniref:Potassium-transporting ATPase KdpC subunit n=1 Tax=Arthrobacter echini TaxID=1529066 RepID=A0A5D0XRB8_9MICC|nr:potassium-transporting ATPase subunit KdpC [Arthrobacter echini]TYC98381.1 potassium-transporting ATPase subunit KdpC [Arthrobacter echini]
MSSSRNTVRQLSTAVRVLVVLTLLLGVAYPLAITSLAQVAMKDRADGQIIVLNGVDVGSALIGQDFTDDAGEALPEWFQSRPSAAGTGYDGASSGGSNLGPENPDLLAAIDDRRAPIAQLEGVDPSAIPADALTASASGLDPHISPDYALLQAPRIAAERGLEEGDVEALVEANTQGPDLGYLGESTVNVLKLNIALAQLDT